MVPASDFVKFAEPPKIADAVNESPSPVFNVKLVPTIVLPVPVNDPSVNVSAPTVSVSSARSNIPPLTVTAFVSLIT